jgi:hypothetical protein
MAVAVLAFASVSVAETLSYEPDSIYVSVAAGGNADVPLTVSIGGLTGFSTYYLWFIDSVAGDVPIEWLSVSRSTAFLSRWSPSSTTSLTISVPEGAEPGIYQGYLFPKAMKSHQYADPGAGIYIEVEVPSICSGEPEVIVTSLSPSVLWPPNHSMVEVSASGIVLVPSGCTLYELGYSVVDEYGEYSGIGAVELDASSSTFTTTIPVEASRTGQDKDGRHYTITIFATDDLGVSESEPLDVVVPHDMRPSDR